MKKAAIRYLRISTDRQSNFSIDGQDMQTRHWCDRNEVEIIDTFTDEGYSARNFDRPDFIRLNAFIEKHFRKVDYLVVNAFDRFSRQAGEAIVEIKKLQKKFAIKVVSVSEGVTFDANDPGSFFYAGLMLLKGEDEIIRNRNRINMGIYTAKVKEGRYLGSAPIGYLNSRDERKKPIIVIDEEKLPIVRYCFEAFLNDVPMKHIYEVALQMGLKKKSHSYIQETVLKNPVYTGLLFVKAYKDEPDQLVEGIHEAIIDRFTWNQVQEKLNVRRGSATQILSDAMPLRSVLKCHCGLPLTGAPSRSRNGSYYHYYKCKVSRHLNLSATKAHDRLEEVWKYLSLPHYMVANLQNKSEQVLEERMKANSKSLSAHRRELAEAETKLKSVEEKWILNQMAFETYQRWYSELTGQRMALRGKIEKLSQDQDSIYTLFQTELVKLEDLNFLYCQSSTVQKQQLVRLVFDSKLYWKDDTYRTAYLMAVFRHNELILNDKKLLVVDKKSGFREEIRSGGADRSRTGVQTYLP